MAEHLLLPRFLRTHGLAVVDAIERDDADFFIPVWFEAGFRFSPFLIFQVHASYRVGVETIRYFTWERSIDIMTGQPATVIGEWTDRGHGNDGAGPPFTGDLSHDAQALIQRVLVLAAQ